MKTRQEWLETLIAATKEMVEKVDAQHPPTLPYQEVANLALRGCKAFVEAAPAGTWGTDDCLMLAAQLIHMAREVHFGMERGGNPDEPNSVAEVAEPPCRECRAVGYHKMDCTFARRPPPN